MTEKVKKTFAKTFQSRSRYNFLPKITRSDDFFNSRLNKPA